VKVLVLNCGSSSVKYQLLLMPGEELLARGLVERIGEGRAVHIFEPQTEAFEYHGQQEFELGRIGHEAALRAILDTLQGKGQTDMTIEAVGHRVVHGGESFTEAVKVDGGVKEAIRDCISLAPLHNPPNLVGIEAAEDLLPGIPNVAVFDTAFHQTLPPEAYRYAIPARYYHEYRLRRYGFHGTSHRYVAGRAAEMLGTSLDGLRLLTCHLGNGCSIAAIKDGQSVETSMGFTPLEGLIMGTRSGDLDPAVVTHIQRVDGIGPEEAIAILNKDSGLLGLSGYSNDMRDIEGGRDRGNDGARLAFDGFVHRVKKYIGAYTAVLNGLDGIVFTAGIGQKSPAVREAVCRDMEGLGITFSPKKNQQMGKTGEGRVDDGGPVAVLVVKTNEELAIAREAHRVVSQAT